MTKKVLALLLSVLMLIGMFPMSAAAASEETVTMSTGYTSIADLATNSEGALVDAGGGVYNLLKNLKIASHVQITADTTINLNGNTLERIDISGGATIRATTLYVATSGVTLTVNGGENAEDKTQMGMVKAALSTKNSADYESIGKAASAAVNVANGTAIFNNVAVECDDIAVNPNGNGVVTLNNCNISSTYSPLTVGNNAQVTVSCGSVTSDGSFAVATNAVQTTDNAKITIKDGAQITTTAGSDASAIFLPRGTLTIEGAETTITGPAGIVVRGGTLNFVNGQVEATGTGTITAGSGGTNATVPCSAIVVNNMGPDSGYGESNAVTITTGTFKAANGEDVISYCEKGVEKTEEEDLAAANITVKGGEFSAPLASTSYLEDGLLYEAYDGDSYSYHKTLGEAVTAAGEEGTVTPVVGDDSTTNTRVIGLKNANGDAAVTPTTTFDKETAIYEVAVSGTTKPSNSEAAGGANYWFGIGIKAPEGYTALAVGKGNYKGNETEGSYTDNVGDDPAHPTFDVFQEGGSGFAFWPVPEAFPEDGSGIYRTLKWTAEGKPDYYEVYHFTTTVTKSGALVTLDSVGYEYDQEAASTKANAAVKEVNGNITLTDVYKNTIWATFKLTGTPTGQIKVTFEKDSTTYPQLITASSGSTGGIAYISFEEGHQGDVFDPVEGEYTITAEVDGVADEPMTIEIYKVTANLGGGTLAEGEEIADTYTADPENPEAPNVEPTKEGYTFKGWGTPVTSGYVITYTAQWQSNSSGTVVPDDDDEPGTEKPAYNNCPKDSTCPIAQFKDTATTGWYHDAVHFVLDNGLMSGNGDGTFTPDSTLTRAMLVQILYNLEGKPADVGPVSFSDVDATVWYADAVRWAASHGIVAGNGDGTFSPEAAITREQVAVIFRNYAKNYLGKNVGIAERTDISKYTDAGKASRWAVDALKWAVGTGLISGTTSTTLEPAATATRAQAASILMKYCENLA